MTKKNTSSVVSVPVNAESKDRHRVMSNERIKYLYSRNGNTIHDKHCVCTKDILDKNLMWSEEYITGLQPCSECMIQAYVSAGAKDPKEIKEYRAFFEKVQMSAKQIRGVYIQNGMKTRIYRDTMTVWYKEDTWRIKRLPQIGHVQLYHNNYAVGENGVREFTLGFHLQNSSCSDTNIGHALNIIRKYEYKPEEAALHTKANLIESNIEEQGQVENKEVTEEPVEEMPNQKTNNQNIWQKAKCFISAIPALVGKWFCIE